MKTFRLFLLCLLPLFSALAPLASAKEPAPKNKAGKRLTLEDVIFDADYLKQSLGAKTLIVPDEKTGEIPSAAIAHAGLGEKTQLFTLPDNATRPVLKDSIAPALNSSFKMKRDPSRANFFLFVGTDGKVKTLHCYDTNDQVYAIIAADALIKWTYTPARIGETAVPVLVAVEMKFDESDIAIGSFRGSKQSLSAQGNPPPPRPVRPNAGGGGGPP